MASALIGALRVTLGLDSARFEDGLKQARKSLSSAEKNFKKIGGQMQAIGATMTLGITAPFLAVGKASIQAASDAAELQSAFNVTFGAMAKDMNAWAEQVGNAMGRSTQEIQQGANAFGLFFNQAAPTKKAAADLSKQFSILAQDLASFHNTKPEEALLALRSGLSGEAEPMRRYGVFLNEAAVAAQAAEMGLKGVNGKLTDQQKIMARAQIILKATKDAQGDVIRTADSHANRVRAAAAAWEEMKVAIGTQLVPALTPLIGAFTDLLNKFNEIDPGLQKFIVGGAAIAAALGPVITVLGVLVSALAPLAGLLATSGTAATAAGAGATAASAGFAAFLTPLAAVAAAAAAGYAAWKNWDQIQPILEGLWTAIQETLGPPLQDLINAVGPVLADLGGAFGELWETVGPWITELGKLVAQVFGTTVVGVIKTAAEILRTAFGVIGELIRGVAALLRGDFMGAWDAAANALRIFVTGTIAVLRAALTTIVSILEQIVTAVGRWMLDRLNAIWNGVKSKIEDVKGWFKGLWDAVVGHSYIPDMVEGIGIWMAKLDAKMVEPAKKAAERTKQAFEQLQSILARLFPEQVRANQFASELAFLEKNAIKLGLSADQAAEAVKRLKAEMDQEWLDSLETVKSELLDGPVPELDLDIPEPPDLDKIIPKIGEANEAFKSLGETIKGEVIHGLQGMMRGFGSLKDIALNVLFAIGDAIIENLVNNLAKAGDAMGGGGGGSGLTGLLGSIASWGMSLFGGGGGFDFEISGFAQGGRPLGPSIIGENGPELWQPDTSGRIIPNNALGRGNMKVGLKVEPSPYFDARVEEISAGVVFEQAPTLVSASTATTTKTLGRKRLR